MTKDIVPWKCHICKSDFDTPDGGICGRCSRATCHDHLHQIGAKKLEATWVCADCLTSEEKSKITVYMKNKSAFQYVLFGMLYGALIPGFIFFIMDKSKGWNPYGWWFMATFGCAILGGLIGLVLFGYLTKKRKP